MDESKIELTERLRAEGRWDEAANFKETARADFRVKGDGRQEAVKASWEAMAEAYQPLPVVEATAEPASISGRVQGPDDIPASWGTLPANASLQSGVNWVQASRLLIVEETASGATRVHLDRAPSPVPSKAALGWLATNITDYSKYVDILVKAVKDQVDEAANERRERVQQLEEIAAQLREMFPEGSCPTRGRCPTCGQAIAEAWRRMVEAFPPLPKPEVRNAFQDDAPAELAEMHDRLDDASPDLVRDTLWVYEHLASEHVQSQDAPGPGAWELWR